MDSTLKVILLHAKSEDDEKYTWRSLARTLAPLYHSDMKLTDVMHVLLKTYKKLSEEKQFEVQYNVSEAMLFPTHSISMLNPKQLDTTMTMEQFYNDIVEYILYDFRYACIWWCTTELYGDKK
jgi:hypothetical protein